MKGSTFLVFVWLFLAARLGVCEEVTEWQYLEKRSSAAPALSGELSFKGGPMPDAIKKEGVHITTMIGTYRFFGRKDDYNPGGFLHENDTAIKDAKDSSVTITEEDLNKHFYEAGFYDRKQNTPLSWVYIKVDNNEPSVTWTKKPVSLWADPAFLADVSLTKE